MEEEEPTILSTEKIDPESAKRESGGDCAKRHGDKASLSHVHIDN